jgi:uncharacterized integral membrane protein
MARRSESPAEPPQGRAGRIPIRLYLWGVVALLAAVWVLQNSDDHQVNFIFFSVTMPQWLLILLAMGVGALLVGLGGPLARRRRARTEK